MKKELCNQELDMVNGAKQLDTNNNIKVPKESEMEEMLRKIKEELEKKIKENTTIVPIGTTLNDKF